MENPSVPYLYLTLSEVFQSYQELLANEVGFQKKYANKNYNEIIDYTLIDMYSNKYKGNSEIENCRIMVDLLVMFYEVILFEQDENNKLILNYYSVEKDRIHEIIISLKQLKKRKKLNKYTANKLLGFAYFMLNKSDTSITFFKNGIETFPIDKQNDDFNLIECYDAIIFIYFQQSDTANFRLSLNSKIKNEPEKENRIEDLILLAFDYFQNGNIVKAEEYCQKIRNIRFYNFDALRLLAHISFLKGQNIMAEYYGEIAKNNANSNQDTYNLAVQFIIYQMHNNDLKT